MTGIAVTTGFGIVQTSRTLFARNPVVFLPTARKIAQVRFGASSQPPSDAAKRGLDEVKKVGNQMKEQVASHAENVTNQSKDAAGKAAGAADNMAEKAKETAQDAWKAAKETAQKLKKNVSEKAGEAADAVKENIDAAKRKMN